MQVPKREMSYKEFVIALYMKMRLEQEEQNDSEEETIKESIQKIYKQFLTHHTTMSQTNQFSK